MEALASRMWALAPRTAAAVPPGVWAYTAGIFDEDAHRRRVPPAPHHGRSAVRNRRGLRLQRSELFHAAFSPASRKDSARVSRRVLVASADPSTATTPPLPKRTASSRARVVVMRDGALDPAARCFSTAASGASVTTRRRGRWFPDKLRLLLPARRELSQTRGTAGARGPAPPARSAAASRAGASRRASRDRTARIRMIEFLRQRQTLQREIGARLQSRAYAPRTVSSSPTPTAPAPPRRTCRKSTNDTSSNGKPCRLRRLRAGSLLRAAALVQGVAVELLPLRVAGESRHDLRDEKQPRCAVEIESLNVPRVRTAAPPACASRAPRSRRWFPRAAPRCAPARRASPAPSRDSATARETTATTDRSNPSDSATGHRSSRPRPMNPFTSLIEFSSSNPSISRRAFAASASLFVCRQRFTAASM